MVFAVVGRLLWALTLACAILGLSVVGVAAIVAGVVWCCL